MTGNDREGGERPLNPALTNRTEQSHDLSPTPAPIETASASEGWPVAWLLIVAVGILLALYFIL